jgi:hypothetical protein
LYLGFPEDVTIAEFSTLLPQTIPPAVVVVLTPAQGVSVRSFFETQPWDAKALTGLSGP